MSIHSVLQKWKIKKIYRKLFSRGYIYLMIPSPNCQYAVAFTQTFPIMNVGPRQQFYRIWPVMSRVLKSMGPFEAYPEFTVNGNIHLHGRICVKDKVNYQRGLHYLRRTQGYNLFKAIDNEEKWNRYITKDVAAMQKLLSIPLPLNGDSDERPPMWVNVNLDDKKKPVVVDPSEVTKVDWEYNGKPMIVTLSRTVKPVFTDKETGKVIT